MVESEGKVKTSEKVKTFKNLKEEVINLEKCCTCGACVSYCESQAFNVIEMKGYNPDFKSEATEENCTECGLCYYVCPQTEPLLEKITKIYSATDQIGKITMLTTARTSDEHLAAHGQDGGVVSTVLRYLFNKHLIDAAIVSEYDKRHLPIPKLIFCEEDLIKSAGTRYTTSSQLLPLKDLYNIPSEILKEKGIYDINLMRVAFVGTPCQLRALRKMHTLSISPAHTIKYVIGLFCFENFHYTKLHGIIEKEIGVKPSEISRTWIKKNFFLLTNKNETHEINIRTLDPAVRSSCHTCNEFTGMYSDISVGSLGAQKGYSMIVIRNEKGEDLINKMITDNYIVLHTVALEEVDEWTEKREKQFKKMISRKQK